MFRHVRRGCLVVATLGCLIAVLIATPKAQADLVTWDFPATLDGATMNADIQALKPATEDVNVFAPALDITSPAYDWTLSVTSVWVQVLDVLWQESGETIVASGTTAGPPPFDIFREPVEARNGPNPTDELIISADLAVYVDAAGVGHFDATNIVWGTYNTVAVTGIALGGTITVNEVVPEPSSIVLLLIGAVSLGLIVVRRRRR